MMNQDVWDIYGGLPSYALVLVQLQGFIFLAWEVAKSILRLGVFGVPSVQKGTSWHAKA